MSWRGLSKRVRRLPSGTIARRRRARRSTPARYESPVDVPLAAADVDELPPTWRALSRTTRAAHGVRLRRRLDQGPIVRRHNAHYRDRAAPRSTAPEIDAKKEQI